MNGVINVLKPPGMTSSNAVSDIRRILGVKKAGHMGTLDPGAAGVLPIGVGKSTRLFDYLANKDKIYIAEITFGVRTDTQDTYGVTLEQHTMTVRAEQLQDVLPCFTGERMQTPSAYSAISVNGVKAYKLARRGQNVDLGQRARRIFIYKIELIEQTGKNRFLIKVNCSKGTYIRRLAEDVGQALGCPACLSFLLRIQSGPYVLEGARALSEIATMYAAGDLSFLLPADAALCEMRSLKVDAACLRLLLNGVPVQTELGEGYVRLYCNGFIGIGEVRSEVLKISTNLTDE